MRYGSSTSTHRQETREKKEMAGRARFFEVVSNSPPPRVLSNYDPHVGVCFSFDVVAEIYPIFGTYRTISFQVNGVCGSLVAVVGIVGCLLLIR